MTKFKVGSLIFSRSINSGLYPDESVDCEGIIVRHWQTKGHFNEAVDNVDIYITFDQSWPEEVGKVIAHRGFKESRWELKHNGA